METEEEAQMSDIQDSNNDAVDCQDNDPCAEYEKQLSIEKDKYVRLYAEFENYRRRTKNEINDIMSNAEYKVLLKILPIVDDIERITVNSPEVEGINIVFNNVKNVLKQVGVEEINTNKGDVFDDSMHEAITTQLINDSSLDGKIVNVIEKGYKINDKVLRFVKVIIGEYKEV